MTSLLRRAFAALRVWLGWNDPSENHLHPAHGWLLPLPTPVLARVPESPLTAPVAPNGARGRRAQ